MHGELLLSSGRQKGSNATSSLRIVGALILLLFSSAIPFESLANDLTGSQTTIACGPKVIRVNFIGNRAFTATELKTVISPDKHLRGLDKSCELNAEALSEVASVLTAFYYDNGFLNVRVDNPQVKPPNRVMFGINEGPLYRFGSITVEESSRFSKGDVVPPLTVKSGQPFRGFDLQQSVLALSDFYADRGYAFVYVDPRTKMDSLRHLISVSYYIKPGHQIRVARITISGNTATDDDLIRRTLKIREHQLYSAKAFRESKAQLDGLGIFGQTKITTEPSAKPNEIDVNIIVVEKARVNSSLLDTSAFA